MKTALFDYHLPPELIAQEPAEPRGRSRLLVLDRRSGRTEHRLFAHLPEYLGPDDALVLNDTRVIRARLYGTRSTGGRVEVLLIRPARPAGGPDSVGGAVVWQVMLQARGRLVDGETLDFAPDLSATLLGRDAGGLTLLEVHASGDVWAIIDRVGRVPLPPYIKRPRTDDPHAARDAERYQTVYARSPGAVAAPTAGLHFTPELVDEVRARGCTVAPLTLHVGPGTFKPVEADDIEEHRVDPEYYRVPAETAEAVNRARRVVAVGTTTCRVLETLVRQGGGGRIAPGEGWTDLFIRPPFDFRSVGALVTNFHLPRSSLLMLVSAFASRELILAAYAEAIRERYRFYSYGDAMLIL